MKILKDYFLVSLSIRESVQRGREYDKTILAFYYDGSKLICSVSLSELECKIFIGILLHDLGNCKFEVFLGYVDSPLSQCKHTCLGTHGFTLGTGGTWHLLGYLVKVDATHQVHFTRVNLEDINPSILVRIRELNLPINSTGSEQCIIQNIDSVCRHNNLDILGGLETIQLVQKLEHRTLYFRVTFAAFHTGATD